MAVHEAASRHGSQLPVIGRQKTICDALRGCARPKLTRSQRCGVVRCGAVRVLVRRGGDPCENAYFSINLLKVVKGKVVKR